MSFLSEDLVFKILSYSFNDIDSILCKRFYHMKNKELKKRITTLQKWF